jgi:branched-chain amino acid transport system ATP-binding protein
MEDGCSPSNKGGETVRSGRKKQKGVNMGRLLEVSDMSKHFGGIQAIKDISFHVERGEILGIIGPNGAGKTTLVNLISGIYRADKGRVTFNEREITGNRMSALVRMGLARTFQATVLYAQETVLENVLRGTHLTQEAGFFHLLAHTRKAQSMVNRACQEATDLLVFLGLDKVANQLPSNLPYGYQKSLGVGIAMATNPQLLMLDEPAAGLNSEEALEMKQRIEKINERGVSLIVVDHNMRFIMSLCHRIVVLNYGQKLAEGTPREIQRNEKVIKAYLGGGHREVIA